jgi:hypothetical protein
MKKIQDGKWEAENIPDFGPVVRLREDGYTYCMMGDWQWWRYTNGQGWESVRSLTQDERMKWVELYRQVVGMPVMDSARADKETSEEDLILACEDGILGGAMPADI